MTKEELAGDYARKYWEAGNLVVTLVFGVTFAIYLLFAQSPQIRSYLVRDSSWAWLVGISAISNIGLAVVLWRLSVNELLLVKTFAKSEPLIEPVESALHLRWALLAFNLIMFCFVIGFVVAHPPGPNDICPPDTQSRPT